MIEKKINCKKDSESADQYYECLNKSKDTIDFCYDQYVIDLRQDVNHSKSNEIFEKVDKCVDESNSEKFDHIIPKFEYSIANSTHGVTGFDFYKSQDYHDMLKAINEKLPLEGALKCS